MKLCECGCGSPVGKALTDYPKRNLKKGDDLRFRHGHHNRVLRKGKYSVAVPRGYRQVAGPNGKAKAVHIIKAENALGRRLPKGASVHHADGTKSETSALVICPNMEYHKLLHQRMRVKAAGGNVNTDKLCSRCRLPKPKSAFSRKNSKDRKGDGLDTYCRECRSVLRRRVAA